MPAPPRSSAGQRKTRRKDRHGAGINNTDPDLERDPPPPPTPVAFPQAQLCSSRPWNDASPPPHIQPLFSKVQKPSDISPQHLEALNVRIESPCSPEALLPLASDGSSYLPPLTPDQAINAASYADAVRAGNESSRKRKEYDERLSELRIDNDTGYRIITRSTKPGTKAPRLAFMRKFWEGAESLAQYWDTSLDHYYEGVPVSSHSDEEKGAKRQRLDSTQTEPASVLTLQTNSGYAPPIGSSRTGTSSIEKPKVVGRTHAVEHDRETTTGEGESVLSHEERSSTVTPQLRPCPRYKGRRTACGRDMPDQFRADTVKAFVEGTVWPFTCITAPPRHIPLVRINKLNLPVRQTAAVYRRPIDRAKSRSGWVEGPLLAVQCRPDTDFDTQLLTDVQKEAKGRLDLIRELGGLLLLAEERARQGKIEIQSGEGTWWTTKPRWGGGPGGEVADIAALGHGEAKDVLRLGEDMVSSSREQRDTSRRSRRKTPAMLWKEVKPGSKQWDSKTQYEAIGKDPESEYDEIFMVSSLYHHISILKMTVHVAYIEYLRSEVLPNPLPKNPDWGSPRLQRTQWYDLLDVDQRVEAFRALWGVMSYLTRPTTQETQAGGEADDDTKMNNS